MEFLDIEHFLELRGPDTWSEHGNESQVIIKTLIGQILTEKMPNAKAVPALYRRFAEKLQLFDRIITFNYDVLLERVCEAIGKPFRLVPRKYGPDYIFIGPSYSDEVVILKMHGSIDWFSRKSFRIQQEQARKNGYPDFTPDDPIFNSGSSLRTNPLVAGPRYNDDPLLEVHRLLDIEYFYRDPPFLRSPPILITPSKAKIVYARQFEEFWYGQKYAGGHSSRRAIIGYSLPKHDDYARQLIYRLVTNYQYAADRMEIYGPKEPLMVVDLRRDTEKKKELQNSYRFIDWDQAKSFFDGFNEDVVEEL